MSVTLDRDKCAVHAMRKTLKLSYDGGDSGRKKFERGLVAPMVGFPFYKFCIFNAIFKDDAAALNCIVVQPKEVHSRQLT
jgi:hypothetical protein